jgi:hypothetical protein
MTCRPHFGLVFRTSAPDVRFRSRSPNLALEYTTGAVAAGRCRHGYRRNGAGDGWPVYGVVLGDSHSENIRLDDREVWVSRLSLSTGRRFVNLGLGSSGVERHRAVARALLPTLRPRLVVLQLCENDIFEDARIRQRRRSPPGEPHPPIRSPEAAAIMAAEGAQEVAAVSEIGRLAAAQGARLAIVHIGDRRHLEGTGIEAWAARNGVPLLQFAPSAGKAGRVPSSDIVFRTDGHYNARGNGLLAEQVREFLSAEGWL